MSAGGARAFQPVAVAFAFLLSLPAWAQQEVPDTLVTDAQRHHAALMILLLVVCGVALTIGLLWFLRRRGLLPEEKPDGRLQELEDEIERRSDEISQ
jgi:nitrate reductase gamma subunit